MNFKIEVKVNNKFYCNIEYKKNTEGEGKQQFNEIVNFFKSNKEKNENVVLVLTIEK